MEGFFVRTLGMHRVYNSAFMNMLKMEENASIAVSSRTCLNSTRNPQKIREFHDNPDEETAVAHSATVINISGLP